MNNDRLGVNLVQLLRVVVMLSVCTILMSGWSVYESFPLQLAFDKSMGGSEMTTLMHLASGSWFFLSLLLVAFFGFKRQVHVLWVMPVLALKVFFMETKALLTTMHAPGLFAGGALLVSSQSYCLAATLFSVVGLIAFFVYGYGLLQQRRHA